MDEFRSEHEKVPAAEPDVKLRPCLPQEAQSFTETIGRTPAPFINFFAMVRSGGITRVGYRAGWHREAQQSRIDLENILAENKRRVRPILLLLRASCLRTPRTDRSRRVLNVSLEFSEHLERER